MKAAFLSHSGSRTAATPVSTWAHRKNSCGGCQDGIVGLVRLKVRAHHQCSPNGCTRHHRARCGTECEAAARRWQTRAERAAWILPDEPATGAGHVNTEGETTAKKSAQHTDKSCAENNNEGCAATAAGGAGASAGDGGGPPLVVHRARGQVTDAGLGRRHRQWRASGGPTPVGSTAAA